MGCQAGRLRYSPRRPTPLPLRRRGQGPSGEVAEWLKAHAWKACIRETVSRVRIPLSPPINLFKLFFFIRKFIALVVLPPHFTPQLPAASVATVRCPTDEGHEDRVETQAYTTGRTDRREDVAGRASSGD